MHIYFFSLLTFNIDFSKSYLDMHINFFSLLTFNIVFSKLYLYIHIYFFFLLTFDIVPLYTNLFYTGKPFLNCLIIDRFTFLYSIFS